MSKSAFYCFFILIPLLAYQQNVEDSLRIVLQEKNLSNESRAALLIQLIEVNPYSDAEQVTKWALEAVELSEESDDRNLFARALNMAGNSYWIRGDLRLALEYMQRSLSLAKELNDEPLVARNYGNLGNVYLLAGDYPKALDYYRESLQLYQELANELRIFVMFVNLGNIYLKIDQLDSAGKYLSLAEEAYVPRYERMRPTLLSNRCELTFRNGNFNEADSMITTSLEIAEQLNDIRILSHLNQIRAQISVNQGSNSEALEYALTAYEYGKKTGSLEVLFETTNVLAQCYAQNRMFQDAFTIQESSNKFRDSLQNDQIRFQLEIFHYSNEEREKELLENEIALNESIAKRREVVIYSLLAILIIILAAIFLLYRNRSQIKKQSTELAELNEFKTKLFAIISHDMRSPMQTIISLIHLVDDNLTSVEMLKETMPDVKKRVKRMSDLLETLLLWTTANLKGYNISSDSFNLSNKVDEIIQQVHELYSQKNIGVSNTIDENYEIVTDTRILSIVLNNLIVNAFKFSNDDDTIDIASYTTDGKTVIEIKDTGIGMDSEVVDNIFSFTKKGKKGTDNEIGVGIGLILCNDFVKLLGGEIWMESTPGVGTSAFVSIPLK